MIHAIIFDLWNTLGGKHTSVSRKLFAHFHIPITKATSVQYERSVQIQRWKTMEHMAYGFLASFRILPTKKNISLVKTAFLFAISHARPFPGMLSLLKQLKKTHRLAILSNTTMFESCVVSRWGLESYFDHQVYSWQIGSIKPSRKNFEAVRKRLRIPFNECLFVDDNILNVSAARSLGMKAIHFKNVRQLRNQLLKK